ncbi:MAG TPA: recombinase family protein [Ktedonobacterales bacterium]
MAKKATTRAVPIEDRDPASARAVIYARKSNTVSDVQSQVETCQEFIGQMGWTLVADPYTYSEIGKSGRYNVKRKVLESVLLLAERREVDVIVAREPERLHRVSEQRNFYMLFCDLYNVEWRFANLRDTDGKVPDTFDGRLRGWATELFGELEAQRIAERMTPGRERRYAAGLPAGGRYGAPYGYKWRPKGPDEKTYSGFIEDPEQATIVREIFSRFATDEHASARGLARDFAQRGISRAAGGGKWNGTSIIELVRNPVYCGRGRRKRWQVVREDLMDEDTGLKNNYATSRNRSKDDDYEETTYPLAEGSVPILVEPDVWGAAQRAIERNRIFGGKIERANSPYPEDATLLHGGFAFCARCGGMMTRHWRSTSKVPMPLYDCTSQVSQPSHFCMRHNINARKVDQIVLYALAKTLTDPQQLLDLADKAEQQAAVWEEDAERAAGKIDIYQRLDSEREKKRAGYLKAIDALSADPDSHEMIADLRMKLAQLDQEQIAAEEDRKRSVPHLERQLEIARRRRALLERLRRARGNNGRYFIMAGAKRTETAKQGTAERLLLDELSLEEAAAILGVDKEAFTAETGIPVGWTGITHEWDGPEAGEEESHVKTTHLVNYWLANAPHDYVRQLLRDLNVKVYIKPPRTKEERALHGLTPHAERVVVRFLADPTRELNDALAIRTSTT